MNLSHQHSTVGIDYSSATVDLIMTRPGPSSCQSCRTKKLKCNRVQPCSNCKARAITCLFVKPPVLNSGGSSPSGTEDIRKRLERLESFVLPKEPIPESPPTEKDGEFQSLQRIGTRDDELVSHTILAIRYYGSTRLGGLKNNFNSCLRCPIGWIA